MTTMQRAFPAPVIPKFFTNNVCGNYQLRRFFNGQDDFICAQGPFRTQTVASQSEEGAAASSLAIAFANINENDKKQVLAFCNAYMACPILRSAALGNVHTLTTKITLCSSTISALSTTPCIWEMSLQKKTMLALTPKFPCNTPCSR